MDVKSINIPDLSFVPTKEKPNKVTEIYIFASFIKPGYHQILIYDPLKHKAYCKDFTVNLNLREDLYPEYPVIEGKIMKKGIRNVFEQWKEETDE